MNKLLPPLLVLLSVLAMILIHRWFPISQLIRSPWNWLGVAIFLIGFALTGRVSFLFKRHDTEINTFKKPRRLVTEGPFSFSRNPIYLGFLFMLIGVAFFLGSLSPWIWVFVFFLVSHYWYIPFEEKNLESIFGDHFKSYRSKVRRWL